MIVYAVVLITAALVFYSVGVWGEQLQRVLRWWHVGVFVAGLLRHRRHRGHEPITGFQLSGIATLAMAHSCRVESPPEDAA